MSTDEQYKAVGWVTGWTRARNGLQLRTLTPRGFRWMESLESPMLLMNKRAYEPSLAPYAQLQRNNVPFEIADLSRLSPLLDPSDLLQELAPAAKRSKHAIYTFEGEGRRIYFPAMLLIRELWLWSRTATKALMTPSSLDIYLSRIRHVGDVSECSASTRLASNPPSDRAIRSLIWLSQAEDARRSWNSVLMSAHLGRLDISLPAATISGWAWGTQTKSGLLACELMSVKVRFALPYPESVILIGETRYTFPPAIQEDDDAPAR